MSSLFGSHSDFHFGTVKFLWKLLTLPLQIAGKRQSEWSESSLRILISEIASLIVLRLASLFVSRLASLTVDERSQGAKI